MRAQFVFIGAGGYSLSLLERTGIPEASGYGAFPVSGQWLRCTNRDVIARHHAKVYGKAEVGAPPMSVPHLDTRWIDGEQELLFGPYAGFTTKFLKEGSWLDLLRLDRRSTTSAPVRERRPREPRPHALPRRPGDAVASRSASTLLRRYCPTRERRRLGGAGRRPARADHQERRQAAAASSSSGPRS